MKKSWASYGSIMPLSKYKDLPVHKQQQSLSDPEEDKSKGKVNKKNKDNSESVIPDYMPETAPREDGSSNIDVTPVKQEL